MKIQQANPSLKNQFLSHKTHLHAEISTIKMKSRRWVSHWSRGWGSPGAFKDTIVKELLRPPRRAGNRQAPPGQALAVHNGREGGQPIAISGEGEPWNPSGDGGNWMPCSSLGLPFSKEKNLPFLSRKFSF